MCFFQRTVLPLGRVNSHKSDPFYESNGARYVVHFLMSQRVLSLLFALCYCAYFITISEAIGAPDQAIARSSSVSDIPERNLTQYVRTLMGTEATGHSNGPSETFSFC